MTNQEPNSKTVKLSFYSASEDDRSPLVTLHNPEILIPSLRDQVGRYGLHYSKAPHATMGGQLKGHRQDFTNMIQSYGFTLEIIPSENP